MWHAGRLDWGAAAAALFAGVIIQCGSVCAQPQPAPTTAATPESTSTAVPSDAATNAPGGDGAGLQPPPTEGDGSAATPRGLFGWGLPPIRWGGQLINDFRAEKTGDEPRKLTQIDITNIRASSYIWQPWFALVGGGLGLVNSKEFRSEGDTDTNNLPRKTSSHAVTGNGDFTLFPVSRFPFNAYVDVSDSRATSEPGSSDFTNSRFGLRQTYRPLEGNTNFAASVDHSTLKSESFGRDTVNALAANYNRDTGPQVFDVSGSHTSNSRSNTGERTAFTNLVARHGYRPEPQLSVDSLASVSNSDFYLLSDGAPVNNRSRFAQANTFATWRPGEDSPLFLTGGARYFQSAIANNGDEILTHTVSGNVAATYALTRQMRISGGATVTQLFTEFANTMVTTQNASANYIGDPVEFRDYTYLWNAGASAANQTGLPEGNRQNAGAQFGHNILRGVTLGPASQLNFNLGQNIATNYDTLLAQSHTLSHNGSVSWRIARDAATTGYVSVLGSDARTTGANANHFQLVNFQASGQIQFSRSSIAAVNMTVQGVRQSTPNDPDAPVNFNSSGNLNYTHLRAFDVPRLRYSVIYTVNDSQFNTRLQGDFNAPRERISQSFEQRLDYNVGRVAMRLSMRVADIEGRRDGLIFFRLAREFGGF